jgi:hypothetical protein
MVGRMVSRIGEHYASQAVRIGRYKEHDLTEDRARSLLIEGVKRGVIGCAHLPAVLDNWENPRHSEFGDPTVWRLFNAVTEVGKGWSAVQTIRRTRLLHGLCDAEVGIAT